MTHQFGKTLNYIGLQENWVITVHVNPLKASHIGPILSTVQLIHAK